jgi:hypothetical protein
MELGPFLPGDAELAVGRMCVKYLPSILIGFEGRV